MRLLMSGALRWSWRMCWGMGRFLPSCSSASTFWAHQSPRRCLSCRCSWKLELGTSATTRSARNTQQCDNAVRFFQNDLSIYFWCLTNHRTKVKNSILCLSFLDIFGHNTWLFQTIHKNPSAAATSSRTRWMQSSTKLASGRLSSPRQKSKVWPWIRHGFDMDSTFNKLQVESRVTKESRNPFLYCSYSSTSMVCPSAFQVSHIWTSSYRFLFFSRKPCQETTMKRHPAN